MRIILLTAVFQLASAGVIYHGINKSEEFSNDDSRMEPENTLGANSYLDFVVNEWISNELDDFEKESINDTESSHADPIILIHDVMEKEWKIRKYCIYKAEDAEVCIQAEMKTDAGEDDPFYIWMQRPNDVQEDALLENNDDYYADSPQRFRRSAIKNPKRERTRTDYQYYDTLGDDYEYMAPSWNYKNIPARNHEDMSSRNHENVPAKNYEDVPAKNREAAPARYHENVPGRNYDKVRAKYHEKGPARKHENVPVRNHENVPVRNHENVRVRNHGNLSARNQKPKNTSGSRKKPWWDISSYYDYEYSPYAERNGKGRYQKRKYDEYQYEDYYHEPHPMERSIRRPSKYRKEPVDEPKSWNRCGVPKEQRTAEILCKMTPAAVECNLHCVHGHTFPEGIVRKTSCSYDTNVWSRKFEECKPFLDCFLKLRSAGQLRCFANSLYRGPRCAISCEEHQDSERNRTLPVTEARTHECMNNGRWSPRIPHCVQREGIKLMKPPKKTTHQEISYP